MKSLLYNILKQDVWLEYLKFKRSQTSSIEVECEELEKYINEKGYFSIAENILNGTYEFSIPKKHLINKLNKQEKRVVYSFNKDEMLILKLISYLISKYYDEKYCSNCYSFRKSVGVKQAFYKIVHTSGINDMCGYKIDIHNYFNSVDVNILLPKLKKFFNEDELLYNFLEKILLDNRADLNRNIIYEKKGIMAGVPISSFLANIYLLDVDEYFYNKNVLYARYSDDIIIFSDKSNINELANILDNKILDLNLELNAKKRKYIEAGQKWEFLGFSYYLGKIDLSDSAKDKMKGKIRRAARKIRRWKIKKNVDNSKAISVMNNKFNKKFYYNTTENELTWAKWYFGIINTDNGLKEIDKYMQQYLRYIVTGKFGKKNFDITYEFLKDNNYKPLVSAYYNRNKIL